MAKDKKSKDIDIVKLRMILDNPSDPKIKKITAKSEKDLESIRERLSGESSKAKMRDTAPDFLKKSDNLEPRILIHEKEEEIIPSEIEPTKTELQKEESKDEAVIQDLFDDEELYEVEKVEAPTPEFSEVKLKEMEKTPGKTEETLSIQIKKEKEPIKEMHVNEEKLPEWESVEETKRDETAEEKEEQTIREFSEVATLDEKIEPQKYIDETGEEIPTWEPMELEKAKEEISSESMKEKPADETLEQVSEQKEERVMAVKETKIELKRAEKEMKKKRKEEQKLKKLEEKKKKRNAKQQEREARKAEKEKQEKCIPTLSELREQKRETKKIKKEQETQIKAQLKNEKILAASKKRDAKELKKKQKKEEKPKKMELKTPELNSDKDASFKENVAEYTVAEWESYNVEEMPEIKPDTSTYTHGDFTLYKKEIKTATGKKRTVHFFSKKIPDVGEPAQLPEDYEVKVNKRTRLPYLKKNK